MANPHPVQPPEFRAAQQKPKYGETALGDPICVRFPIEVDAQLRAMSDRAGFIREAVMEKLSARLE